MMKMVIGYDGDPIVASYSGPIQTSGQTFTGTVQINSAQQILASH